MAPALRSERGSERDPLDLEVEDGVHVETELAEHFVGVLTVLRRPHQVGWLFVELEG